MTRLRTLKLSDEMYAQLAKVEAAAARYPIDEDGFLGVEIEKLRLVDLFIAAIAQQTARARRLPERAVQVVVEVELRRKRRQRA